MVLLLCRGQRLNRHQHILLAHDQVGGVQRRKLEAVAVGDGVGGAGFDTVAAEDAAVVVNVVDLGVAIGGGNANFVGVIRCLNINAVRRAGRRTEKARHALLQTVFVALQYVGSAVALLEHRAAQRALAVRVVFHLRRFEDLPKGDAHPFGDGGDVAHYGHDVSIR